jgi:hypothetical protein
VLYPPEEYELARLVWPCEIEVVAVDNGEDGSVLRSREQSPFYKPGLSNAEIEADPYFATAYSDWLQERAFNWFRLYRTEAPPPEEYEIAGKKNEIIESLRADFSRRWNSWDYRYVVYRGFWEGDYWSGGRDGDGNAIYIPYSYYENAEISPKLFREDGAEIYGEGLDPVTLLAYEFVSESGLDISDINDWTEALRVNFMGTPAPLTIECDDSNCPNHCLEIIRPEDKAWKCICSSDDLEGTPIADIPNRIERKPSPNAPDPPPRTLGQRKAKARALIDKLQPQYDQAKAKYKGHGDAAEAAHNLHRAQDVIAKDPTKPQADRDAAAEKSAQAVRDRDEEMYQGNNAAKAMQDTKRGLDALHDFVGQNKAEEDSGISVGVAPPKSTGWRPPLVPGDGWRPPLVAGGNGWNNTPTYINNNADKSTTQTFGPSGGIQASQVTGGGGFQSPQVSGGGFQSPQVVGGGGFVPGEWNATPTVINETPEKVISQIISED